MSYQVSKTIIKGVTPAILIPMIAEILTLCSAGTISRESAYPISTGCFSIGAAARNWFKHGRKPKEKKPAETQQAASSTMKNPGTGK